MSAPELSAEERQVVERFEAAPAAEESLRERVARAIHAADEWDCSHDWPCENADLWRRYADAALAVLSGPSSDAERAVERVLALADFHTECCEYVKVRDLRAAVEGPSC